ncbi:response regulator [Candidatus Woesearchaeota archaeon]|nr:response regulator [Candidatus Woesearchaeota archaeon]
MKPTVIIVDDEKDIREAFKKTLQVKGFNVITASSGEECLTLLKKQKVDLILLDLLMPEMDGVKTLQNIREINKEVKVVIVTAVDKEDVREKTMGLGVEGYLVKPAGKQDLADMVTYVLSEI